MHTFKGKWITSREFAELTPRNVFHRQLEDWPSYTDPRPNRHVLFRKRITLKDFEQAILYITADDYFKLYINGRFVTQGPAPAYPSRYGYLTVDVTEHLVRGENTFAFHTYYQGLINRVWVSGDNRHGLLCDLSVDGEILLCSDESFKTHLHTGITSRGVTGYFGTQFLEDHDKNASEVGFEAPDFDDSGWEPASLRRHLDYTLTPQSTKELVFESIAPTVKRETPTEDGVSIFLDFGKCYVGSLCATLTGEKSAAVTLRCAQELNEDGSLRYEMRCKATYDERFILSGGCDTLSQYDYKAFRYAELILPSTAVLHSVTLSARHYPFTLSAAMRREYEKDPFLCRLYDLCVHTQKFGVQEVIQDCMDREKGFYMGDGCYTALTHMVLSGDDSIVRKLIDDGFYSSFVTDTLLTCLDCSFCQEIAEYPLLLILLVLWHYRYTKDKEYLSQNYPKVMRLLDAYRREYEKDGLLSELDKWCVVDWPAEYRDGYDVDLTEGQVCHDTHVVINAYYLHAIAAANEMAGILSLPPYREDDELRRGFLTAFYDEKRHLFRDSTASTHTSYIGNVFPYAYGLCEDPVFLENVRDMIRTRGLEGSAFFGSFPVLFRLAKEEEWELIRRLLSSDGAYGRMLAEDATTTFEAWGKDCKWNTSLFHLTYSFAALFLTEHPLFHAE